MTDETRFDDEQVAEILRRASASPDGEDSAGGREIAKAPGMSVSDLQAIAGQVGIAPEAVLRAAAEVARGDHLPSERRVMAGLPIAVGRTVELPRNLSDAEWDRVVVDCQEIFAADGRTTIRGSIREWRNGNLRVVLEPVGAGARLRLSTLQGGARAYLRLGVGGLVSSAALLAANALMLHDGAAQGTAIFFGITGVGALLRNVLVLPAWARTRAQQMEQLGRRIGALLMRGE
jgi:hypothetical protein